MILWALPTAEHTSIEVRASTLAVQGGSTTAFFFVCLCVFAQLTTVGDVAVSSATLSDLGAPVQTLRWRTPVVAGTWCRLAFGGSTLPGRYWAPPDSSMCLHCQKTESTAVD